MPITPEQRAENARRNGAKSKGPVSPEGKTSSSRNALKHGQRANKLALFVPPHYICVCTEDRQQYFRLLDELLAAYQPANTIAAAIVRDIAAATWEIRRLQADLVNIRNLTLVTEGTKPNTLNPDLAEVEAAFRTAHILYGTHSPVARISGQINQLFYRIAQLERRIKFVHATFPPAPPEPLEFPAAPEPEVEQNKESAPPNEPTATTSQPAAAPPLYVNETTPEILAAYRAQFPGRPIVFVPPDAVSRGEEIPDNLPRVPRIPGAA